MYRKSGYEFRLFSHLNFLCATILNFYDVIWLPLLLTLLYATIGQPYDVINTHNGGAWDI